MKIVKNQVDAYCEQIRYDLMKIYNELIEKQSDELQDKILQEIDKKISKVKEYMDGYIDIGGIVQYLVKPKDIVKIEYDDGMISYYFEVKEGRKKSKYYYCGNYVY